MTPLRPDSACCRQLNWRTDLPRDLDPARFEALLAARGWTRRCRHPALKVLRHAEGHEVAWVPASGRVQLRVHVTVAEPERRSRALEIHAGLERCLRALAEPAPSGKEPS